MSQSGLRASRRWLAVVFALGILAFVVVAASASSPATARSSDSVTALRTQQAFAALAWRNVGPLRGSRAIAVAGSASRPGEYYFGAAGGGLWKTTDSGENWTPVTDGFLGSASVGAVAVCAANPDVVYLGTGEADWREWILPGDGVYKSTNGGATWQHVGLENTRAISRIRIDPTDCNRVYTAAMGDPWGPNAERGVFRSTDGGTTWDKVLFVDDKTGAADLSIDPGHPNVLYASMWQAFMRPWGGQDSGPGSGLYKSTDGGATWTDLIHNPGLPDGLIGKIGVAVGANSDRVYAVVSARPGKGVYASDDAGASWRLVNDFGNLLARPHYYTRVVADPTSTDTFWVLTDSLSKSTDGGATFTRVRTPHGDHHDLWINPANSKLMVNANDGGATATGNGGAAWTAEDMSTAQMYNVATTNDTPYLICSGQQENGTACVSSEGDGSFFSVGGSESSQVAVDPTDSNVFYGSQYGGTNMTRFDRALPFQSKRIDVWPEIPFGHAPAELKERFAWSVPFATTAAFPQAVYTSSQHVFRSTNGGQTWDQISPDLTRADPSTLQMPFGPIFFHPNSSYTYATISAIAPSPLDKKLIWAGSDDGLVHVTRDSGRNWSDVTPSGLKPFSYVAKIEASPHDPGTAYLAAFRYRQDDDSVSVYRTDDYGNSWTPITDGIAEGDFAYVVREDPQRSGLLYAGTEHGIYASLDNGDHWQSLQQNLPDTPVRDIAVKGDDLVIATFGRGFWVMDGIAPIRQQSASTEPTRTEAARQAAAGQPAGTNTTGADEARATNGAFVLDDPTDPIRLVDPGVRVSYDIVQPASQATLEFFDEQGNLVRSFSGAAVPTSQGTHTVTWDLRYPGPVLFDGIVITFASTRGPLAPWGNYIVKLTVDGTAQEQRFAIKGDPRLIGVGPGAIREQFKLALAVRDRASDADEGVIALRACRDQVDDRVAEANDPAVTAAGSDIDDGLGTVEQALYQTQLQPGVSWEGVEPLRLNNELLYLLPIIESAESAPTASTYAVFDLLSQRLNARLAELDRIFTTRVAAFNQLIEQHGLAPISCSRTSH